VNIFQEKSVHWLPENIDFSTFFNMLVHTRRSPLAQNGNFDRITYLSFLPEKALISGASGHRPH
jgi:hypothetical protein